VSQFLAVESCGQCTPCKQDGLAIAGLLGRARTGEAGVADLSELADRVGTVSNEARCFLAYQHERVVASVLRLFPEALRNRPVPPPPPVLVAPIVDIAGEVAVLDETEAAKQ